MVPAPPGRMTTEDVCKVGREIYAKLSTTVLKPADKGKFLAIDVLSGDYIMDSDDDVAVRLMLTRRPEAEIYVARAGYRAAHSIGFFE